jgi:hypothetical protein
MKTRKRAVFLVEMLTVTLLLGVGSTLMVVAFGSMFHSQQRLAVFASRYAQVTDLLSNLTRDVRRSTAAQVEDRVDDGNAVLRLTLDGGKPLTYRFSAQGIGRDGSAESKFAAKSWAGCHGEVHVVNASEEGTGGAVVITLRWIRGDARDPEPNRRFDLVVRCAGEHTDEAE